MQTDHDFFVQWHLTERCNLRCSHCYQSSNSGNELSTAEALAFIDEAAATIAAWSHLYDIPFAAGFNITGGEPLLRPDLFQLLGALQGRSIAVHLLTNGILIDRPTADRLRLAEVATVQVSMEGSEPVHDAIRGPGSFRAAKAGIEHLVAAGLAVTINMTLSRRNVDSFAGMIELATAMKVHRLGFSRLVPAGRGRSFLAETLTRDEVAELYRRLFLLETSDLEIVTGDPMAAQLRRPPAGDCGETPLGGCAAGLFGLTVAADGTVMPCRRLPLAIGNIRTESLRAIWATSDILAQLRNRECYRGRCGTCPRWAICRGCRAIAHAHTGDFLAEDPQCFLEVEKLRR
jgi:AdoMet-dependent heme synthase